MEICIYASETGVARRARTFVGWLSAARTGAASSPGSHDNDLITGIMGFRGIGIIRLRNAPGPLHGAFYFRPGASVYPACSVFHIRPSAPRCDCPASQSSSLRQMIRNERQSGQFRLE